MPTPVLYVAGTGRSGSTVLASILGEVDGLFVAGELRYLWQRGMLENRLCGCGVPVRECPVWSRVLALAGHDGDAEARSMVALLRSSSRLRQLPRTLVGRRIPGIDPVRSDGSEEARQRLGAIYAAIAAVTGCRVVVDSSKLPTYANLLAAVPEIDLSVVHLVRDPRGAAHSWSSRKPLQDGAGRSQMERIGSAKSALLWDVWNAASMALLTRRDRYLRLRYEDFVADPAPALRSTLKLVGMEQAPLPISSTREVRLGINHTVAGNPDRLHHGTVTVRADDRWLTAMAARDRRLVTGLTAPLLTRYGYKLRTPGVATRPAETIFDRAPRGESAAARLRRRLRRHLRWGRTEGFGRLVEEDELNPVTRVRTGIDKLGWRVRNPVAAGSAVPVYLVGLQRSGTNMLARGLDTAPEFEVRNENDRQAFERFLLRPDDVVRRIVLTSRHRYVLFKPLCDSHRVDHLLDAIDTPSPGRAIWAYREVDGRVRSAVSKFGRNNLLVLRDIASGRGAQLWQAQRLSPATLDVLRQFDFGAMTPETAAALFWWVRNGLYFDTGLDRRDDVLLASYEDLLADPQEAMSAICAFIGLAYRPAFIAHIAPRSPKRAPLAIDDRVRTLCDELQARLDDALRSQRQRRAA